MDTELKLTSTFYLYVTVCWYSDFYQGSKVQQSKKVMVQTCKYKFYIII